MHKSILYIIITAWSKQHPRRVQLKQPYNSFSFAKVHKLMALLEYYCNRIIKQLNLAEVVLFNSTISAKFNKVKYSQNVLLLVETTPTIFETRIVNEKAESLEMFSTIKFSPDIETNDCTVMSGSGPFISSV